jgi:hypothetical protein
MKRPDLASILPDLDKKRENGINYSVLAVYGVL